MNRRGFTIIEVIMALFVFSVAMLSGLSVYSLGHNTMVRAKEQTHALQIAHNEIIKLRLACITTCPPFGQPDAQFKTEHYIPELSLKYTSYLSWHQVDQPFGARVAGYSFKYPVSYDWYKVVTATVVWHSNVDNVERRLSLCTTAAAPPRSDD